MYTQFFGLIKGLKDENSKDWFKITKSEWFGGINNNHVEAQGEFGTFILFTIRHLIYDSSTMIVASLRIPSQNLLSHHQSPGSCNWELDYLLRGWRLSHWCLMNRVNQCRDKTYSSLRGRYWGKGVPQITQHTSQNKPWTTCRISGRDVPAPPQVSALLGEIGCVQFPVHNPAV